MFVCVTRFSSYLSAGLIALIAFHFVTGFGLVIANFVLSLIENTKDNTYRYRYRYR